MCLQEKEKLDIKLDKDGVGKGWKIFYSEFKKKKSCFFTTMPPLPANQWINEKDYRPSFTWMAGGVRKRVEMKRWEKGRNGWYPVGFHCFLKKGDASSWWLLGDTHEVKFRGIITTGYQDGRQVVVAREIFIPTEI